MSRIIASLILIIISPLLLILYIAVKMTSKGPFIFSQKRAGKNMKPFMMYKIRTMIEGAESLQYKYIHLNEVDSPVFKIRNDPRYTKFGKWLSHSGLDEIPQLLNVIRGDMAFVGPRPLPVEEAENVPQKYMKRFSVLPGMTSMWIVRGAHKLSFREWMELDVEYVERRNFLMDIEIGLGTMRLICKSFYSSFYDNRS